AAQVLARHFEFGPCREERVMVVCDAPTGVQPGSAEGQFPFDRAGAQVIAFGAMQWAPAVPGLVERSSSTAGWDRPPVAAPSANDYLDQKSGTGATISFVPKFARPHGSPPPAAGAQEQPSSLAMPLLNDGAAATSADDREHSVWFDRKGDDDHGRFHVDLQ